MKRLALTLALSLPCYGVSAVEQSTTTVPTVDLLTGNSTDHTPSSNTSNSDDSGTNSDKYKAYRERLKARKVEASLRRLAYARAKAYAARRKPNRGCAGSRITYDGRAVPAVQYGLLKAEYEKTGTCPSPYKNRR